MDTDAVPESTADRDAMVMASVEEEPFERFILADVTRDGAFATVPLEEAASLPAWR